MRRVFSYFSLGVLAAVLALEVVMQILPVSTASRSGYYFDPLILTYPAHYTFRTATGWELRNPRKHRSNNYGFLTSEEFAPDPRAIALIGDSFVEASMLPERERLGPQLARAVGNRPVYALGGPGSSLLDYAERVRFAATRFDIRDFVMLIERGDVRQVLCGSGNIHGPCLDPATLAPRIEKQPEPGAAKRLLRHSALAQYVFGQIKVDPTLLLRMLQGLFAAPAHAAAPALPGRLGPADVPLPVVDTIVGTFFERVQARHPRRIILIFDCRRDALGCTDSPSDPVRDRFMQRASKYGAIVVDVVPAFRRFVRETGLSLNVSPDDTHWNSAANALAARETAVSFSK
jgi:hypothetical protein